VRRFDAVLFDFSGVMVSSAFDAIARHASGHGMTEDEFLEFLLGPYAEDGDHAWHRAERGEIGILDWATDTMARAEEAGMGLDLSFMAGMLGDLEVYDVMVEAARTLRADGYRTSLLTNNIAEGRDSWRPLLPLDDLFDDVVDSCEVGLRKPNP
jgi:putative hydrolase of the HAD superfamily